MNEKKRRKLRVALRKNRQRRARRSDVTRDVLDQGLVETDFTSSERISGKGDLTRHRTVIAVEGASAADGPRRDVDEVGCVAGRVLQAIGQTCLVRGDDGVNYDCTIRRMVRTLARDERSAVVAGDRVLIRIATAGQGVIERVEPRHGVVSRGSQRREHVIVANVDQTLIVASAADPPLKPSLIDRFLISADKGRVLPIVCVNKCDLFDPAPLQRLLGIYTRLGCEVILTSAATGAGIAWLRTLLKDRQTVFAGQSGVGKSSLLNALQPGLALRTGEVSGESRKGKHTTRTARLLELESGGWVVDTPGIRQMQLWDVHAEEVEGHFVEFRPFVSLCRFPNCSHTHETGCGVQSGVARGLISRLRYDSYCRIVTDD